MMIPTRINIGPARARRQRCMKGQPAYALGETGAHVPLRS